MYCIECGAENLDRAKFCMECGEKMPIPGQKPAEPQAPVAPAEPAPEAEKVEETPAPSEEQQEEQEQEQEEEEEEEEEAESEEETAADEEAREEEESPAKEEVKEEAPPESEVPTLQFAKEEAPADQGAGEGEGGAEAKKEEEKEEHKPSEAITMLPAAIPMGIAVKPAAPEVPQGIPVASVPGPGAGEEKAEEEAKGKEAGEEKAAEAETTQPTLAQVPSASAPPPWPPKRPRGMKALGVLCIIAGSLNGLINVVAAIVLVVKLSSIRGAQVPMIVHPTVSLFWIAMACILFVGGIGLVRGRLWGRKLCLFFGYSLIPLMIVSAVAVGTADIVASVGGLSQSYNLLVAAGLFYPALMVVLLMALLTGRIKRWAEFMGAGPGVIPPAQPEPSMPAVFCLLTSLFPPFALFSLILGFVGLRQIRRSEGRKCGRGKAIAGLVISGLVLLAVLTSIGLAIGIAAAQR